MSNAAFMFMNAMHPYISLLRWSWSLYFGNSGLKIDLIKKVWVVASAGTPDLPQWPMVGLLGPTPMLGWTTVYSSLKEIVSLWNTIFGTSNRSNGITDHSLLCNTVGVILWLGSQNNLWLGSWGCPQGPKSENFANKNNYFSSKKYSI